MTTTNVVALAVETPLLYFVEAVPSDAGARSTGKLMRLSTSGGTPAPITLGLTGSTIALLADGPYIYNVDNNESGKVSRIPILGGTTFTLIDGSPSYVQKIRTNSTHVFAMWALSQQHITRVPKAGGMAEVAADSPLFDWIDFVVDESAAYLATKTTVIRVPLGGGAAVIAAADAGESFVNIEIAGSQLILASDKRVAKVATAGGTLAALASGSSYGMTTDGQKAYYFRAKQGGGTTCTAGSDLYAVALSGGPAQHLATDVGACATNVVQDSNGVYWISGDGKSIRAANK